MARAPKTIEPARDAAALLRRLGLAVLLIGLPVAGLLFRRGVVILFPIGAALIVVAAALDGQFRPIRDSLARLAASTGAAAALFVVGWSVLTLVWSPGFPGSGERLTATLVTPALAFAAYLALPDRTRSANLYLAPIGTGAAALLALVLIVTGSGFLGADDDGRSLERGMAALAILLWPSIAWLRSRGRDLQAAALTLAVALAIGLGPRGEAFAALACGAVAYLLVLVGGRTSALVTGGALAVALFCAPLVAVAVPDSLTGLGGWGAIVKGDPARLLTGYGFGELLRGRVAGLLPATIPDSVFVQVWHDLGLVGALAVAVALWTCLAGAARSYGPLLPGLAGGVTTAFALAATGVGIGQAWWPAALSVLALVFVMAERGQFRTRRPRADRRAAP